jgi:polyhydroxyalkanoate synthesis repressor PhaR
MVKDGEDFVVYDAKSGDDITRQVLTHIIVEEEGKGQNLLPIGFLRHLISFYGDSLESVVPKYLDSSMKAFARNQEQMRDYMQVAVGGFDPMNQFEDMGKKNVAMFEEAMKMFMPFLPGEAGSAGGDKTSPTQLKAAAKGHAENDDGQLHDAREQLRKKPPQVDKLTGA